MKKIYTLAFMALAGIATANAQALKLDKNYIIYTGHNGTDKVADVLGNAFLDEDYNTFPVQGGALSTVKHHLTKDYTDAETGVTIKAGDYNLVSASTELKFKDAYSPQGLKNIKKVIYYIGGIGQLQTYVRMTKTDEDGENYVHYEGVPTNRSWQYYSAPDFQWGPNPDGAKKDDADLTYSSPVKLTVDLTNNTDGTEEEISKEKYKVNVGGTVCQGTSGTWYYDYEVTGTPVTEKRMLLQFYEKAFDADNKIVQGTNKIAWDAENRFGVALKKAYVMAVAFICADDNAKTLSINLKDGANATWTDTSATGIDNITSGNAGAEKTVEAVYNVGGMRMNALGKGVNIVRYSDGTSVKVIK